MHSPRGEQPSAEPRLLPGAPESQRVSGEADSRNQTGATQFTLAVCCVRRHVVLGYCVERVIDVMPTTS